MATPQLSKVPTLYSTFRVLGQQDPVSSFHKSPKLQHSTLHAVFWGCKILSLRSTSLQNNNSTIPHVRETPKHSFSVPSIHISSKIELYVALVGETPVVESSVQCLFRVQPTFVNAGSNVSQTLYKREGTKIQCDGE